VVAKKKAKKKESLTTRCLECGYVGDAALKELATLTPEQRKLLAAMAITHHDSPWSDNTVDLVHGCREVLKREYYWDTL
jgi:uncharacterized Zn finger protein